MKIKTASAILFLSVILTLGFTQPGMAASSSLIADVKSGFVIDSENATETLPPASLTKLMTLYLTFGALENGLITMTDKLPISENAASQPRSKLYIQAGDTITVHDAILSLIIKSANDVAVVIAEALSPSEDEFAALMTRTAKSLGLRNTVFKNASGLHAEGQLTTARDMAILTMALIEHYPQYYSLFSRNSFQYNGKTYHSHNIVLKEYEGAEGLKTGFVSAVGYNIISTATQNDTRLVSIVIGEDSQLKRDLHAMRLLDKGFQQVRTQQKAEAEGRLKSTFNPLNRRAFIAKPPQQTFIPIMRAGWRLSQNRLKKQKTNHPTKQIAKTLVLDTSVEQGDSWGIQVGAFERPEKATQIAQKAIKTLGFSDKKIQTPQTKNNFFRSRIVGFNDRNEAVKACQQLQNNLDWNCFLVSPKK